MKCIKEALYQLVIIIINYLKIRRRGEKYSVFYIDGGYGGIFNKDGLFNFLYQLELFN